MAKLEFPKNFFWGAATSAHQMEGHNDNDWTEWEKENAESLAQTAQERQEDEVKYLSGFKGLHLPAEAFQPENYISGRAYDHYNRFREDFDMAKRLGHNAHRFSIEWSRIEPEEGKFDGRETQHYREVVRALREHDLEPFATLWHFTLPLWLSKLGGTESKGFPYYFSRYARYIAEEIKGVRFWITVNESSTFIATAYFMGKWPPQKRSIPASLRVYKNLAQAHLEAYKAIREVSPAAAVGFAHSYPFVEPYRSRNVLDRLSASVRNFWANGYFLYLVGNNFDFLGLHYYMHFRIKFPKEVTNENKVVSDMGWEIYPEGIYHRLKALSKYKKPIYITENGLADAKDEKRAKFIKDHLFWVHKAIREGVDIRGYFYWSLLDNFEWEKGFWPRFGLVEVDYKTMERKIRPSAWEYKKIIDANALEI